MSDNSNCHFWQFQLPQLEIHVFRFGELSHCHVPTPWNPNWTEDFHHILWSEDLKETKNVSFWSGQLSCLVAQGMTYTTSMKTSTHQTFHYHFALRLRLVSGAHQLQGTSKRWMVVMIEMMIDDDDNGVGTFPSSLQNLTFGSSFQPKPAECSIAKPTFKV